MEVQRLLSSTINPLAPSDTVESALGMLMEESQRHLPVVDEANRLVGILSEKQLLEARDAGARVRSLLGREPVSVGPSEHVFDATRAMVKHDLSIMPITDADGRYLGVVRRFDLFDQFAEMLSTQKKGAILSLEVDPRDYSLAKLVHLIEQSDVKVLSAASELSNGGGGPMRVTVKLNTTDATRVRHMLEYHGYNIVASFGEEDSEILERVQEFMRYLEV